ncbi:MAG: hybrid sensor histidine kinase/response regulator [bacterium]|nr:hybrid sensor histidine kinase/response regulator [bacterium]
MAVIATRLPGSGQKLPTLHPTTQKVRPMNVLLVDDEPQILQILAETLEVVGIQAHTCTHGADALEYLASHTVEVMVSDLRMPGMNGLELLQKARAIDTDLQMVILTGFGDFRSAVDALRTGAYDYLNKPINAERLIQTLRIGAEQRRLKIENRTLIENLMEASRLKTDFLHGMSHEIRTPLGHITGFAEILEQTIEGLTEKQQRYLKNIQGAARRLLSMFDDMLQYADMSMETELQLSPILASDLVRQVRSVLANEIEACGADIQVHLQDPESVVYADFNMCEKMLEIVVQNALQFSPISGKIDIRVDLIDKPDLTEEQRAQVPFASAHWLHLSVTDQGPGIPADAHKRIFNLFEQGDGSLGRNHEGTGLGLALGQSLAKRHNGLISLRSAPGEGSTFTIVIPVRLSSS